MSEKDWKKPVYFVGGVIGLLAGLISAHLYARTAEENNQGEQPARISNADAFKLILAAVALVRQISDLAVRRTR